ncbi:hypothetical protein COB55_01345 [Candidatus Wolfebacteria bacterium]|nr:MAG: hypothetical protein COB55_01345 [Candidatus Wolfebacteria bacterium]
MDENERVQMCDISDVSNAAPIPAELFDAEELADGDLPFPPPTKDDIMWAALKGCDFPPSLP